MKTISLCMIVKDEENYIDKCLSSIYDIVDEIIIVDTGSTDNTKEICKKYTNNIYDFEWDNNFSKARNFSFEKATKDYILWLDADDVILDIDRERFKKLKKELNNQDCISMVYNYSFDKDKKPILKFRRNRLVKRELNLKWEGFVHEIIDYSIDNSIKSDVEVTHTRTHSNSDRNLKLYLRKKELGEEFDSRDTLYFAKELYYNERFKEAIIQFNNFLNFDDTWFEDEIDTHIKLYECHTFLERTNYDLRRKCLFDTFKITIPRAEALYRLAVTYIEELRYYEAIFYLNSILALDFPENSNGFINKEMWFILPNLQLVFLYFNIGNYEKSLKHHKECLRLDPNNESVKHNQKFFLKGVKKV